MQAFHYILKPYQPAKIKEVLTKALRETEQTERRYFIIENKSGSLRLTLQDILYFKSERRSICAVTECGQEVFYGRLDDTEEELRGCFQRVHNRYLVNMNHVTRVESTRCLCGGEEIPVSRAYKQQLAVAFARMMLR